jgi:hypothetical protein
MNNKKEPIQLRQQLDQTAQNLAQKHLQRLDEMTTSALYDASQPTKVAKILHKKAQKLAEKHQAHLDAMSEEVLQAFVAQAAVKPVTIRVREGKTLINLITKPASIAFVSLCLLSVAILFWANNNHQPMQGDINSALIQANAIPSTLPSWVKDTNIPLELLENMDFYVWLSQSQYAQNNSQQTQAFLVAAWQHQSSNRE